MTNQSYCTISYSTILACSGVMKRVRVTSFVSGPVILESLYLCQKCVRRVLEDTVHFLCMAIFFYFFFAERLGGRASRPAHMRHWRINGIVIQSRVESGVNEYVILNTYTGVLYNIEHTVLTVDCTMNE